MTKPEADINGRRGRVANRIHKWLVGGRINKKLKFVN